VDEGEEREDVEEAFRALKASIVAALSAALGAAPVGYTWSQSLPPLAVRKVDDDQYALEILGREALLSRKNAVAFILMFIAQELIRNG